MKAAARRLARLAWAFLYLLASRPAYRCAWLAQARSGAVEPGDHAGKILPKTGL
jgi:hypothetical protein